jgi:hypothetical protein
MMADFSAFSGVRGAPQRDVAAQRIVVLFALFPASAVRRGGTPLRSASSFFLTAVKALRAPGFLP